MLLVQHDTGREPQVGVVNWCWLLLSNSSSREYNLIGVLMGLAVYNSIILDLHFPSICYRKLLTPPVVPQEVMFTMIMSTDHNELNILGDTKCWGCQDSDTGWLGGDHAWRCHQSSEYSWVWGRCGGRHVHDFPGDTHHHLDEILNNNCFRSVLENMVRSRQLIWSRMEKIFQWPMRTGLSLLIFT